MASGSTVYPVRVLLGGIWLAIPVHSLLVLNGSVFGISGFLHRSVKGNTEALLGTATLVASGAIISLLDPSPIPLPPPSLWLVAASGALVGLGTKLSNGCTSGHMLSGVSRLSSRSIVATASFFSTGVLTASLYYASLSSFPKTFDWRVQSDAAGILVAQIIPSVVNICLFSLFKSQDNNFAGRRSLAIITNATSFGLALHLTNMTSPLRVLRFLLLPYPRQFDPSLAFLALGALPLVTALYQLKVGFSWKRSTDKSKSEPVPALGGLWSIPVSRHIDTRLVAGAAIFGVGWGLSGICPGPALVNFGRAIAQRSSEGIMTFGIWLGAAVCAGLLV